MAIINTGSSSGSTILPSSNLISGGNAIIYLCTNGYNESNTQTNISNNSNSYGSTYQTPVPLWLTSIETGSSLQFVQQPLQTGYSYVPVRRAEMSLQFTAVWPNRLLNEMNQFSELLRQHYFYALANNDPIPMKFIYLATRTTNTNQNSNLPSTTLGNPLEFYGWVRAAANGFKRFQSLYSRTFIMEILTQPSAGSSTLPATVNSSQNTNYIPTASTASQYQSGWYSVSAGSNPTIVGLN